VRGYELVTTAIRMSAVRQLLHLFELFGAVRIDELAEPP
jgi:hypothetical protein